MKNNFLRPFPAFHPYKEYIIAAFIMLASYLTYFVIVPKFYLSGYFKRFRLSAASLVIVLTFFELFILYRDLQLFKPIVIEYLNTFYIQTVFFIIIRNSCVLVLFFLWKI